MRRRLLRGFLVLLAAAGITILVGYRLTRAQTDDMLTGIRWLAPSH